MNRYKLVLLSIILSLSLNAKDEYSIGADMQRPYDVIVNPLNGFYYISNIVGGPNSQDGVADISALWFENLTEFKLKARVSPPISTQYPETKLNSPTGMAVTGEHLLIADIDSIAIFKQEKDKRPTQIGRFKIPGAQRLESIVVTDSKTFYLSDSQVGAIFCVTDFFDPETRKIEVATKIKAAKGMIHDTNNNALLIVSSEVNTLYEYNLLDAKESKTHTIGPPNAVGFSHLCMGNQEEIYLTHFTLGKVLVYFRDADRPKTIPQPMTGAMPFINNLRGPLGIIYDKANNRVIFTEFYTNSLTFKKGLRPQLTLNQIENAIDFEIK
jgi:hypothetical protein